MVKRTLCAMALMCVAEVACMRLEHRMGPAKPPVATGAWRAGLARADITPVPGYSTGGHGPSGAETNGRWMPLRARAVYLEDGAGRAVALVACDLWSISGGLPDRVAELVQARVPALDRDRIMLSATHTHQSCAGFSTAGMYSMLGSKRMGFDRVLYEFLARRIAAAVVAAAQGARAAEISWHVTGSQAWSRNRSLGAFRANAEAAEIVAEGRAFSRGPVAREGDGQWAVDARMRVLRIAEADEPTRLLGLAGFLAVHPECMPNRTPFYSPDLIGWAADHCERALRATPDEDAPVVALFNTMAGDVSATWRRQGIPDTLRIGQMLADDVLHTAGTSGERVRGSIHYAAQLTPLAGQAVRGSPDFRTACDALAGLATLGGAEDGRTDMYRYTWWWREGVRGQGPSGHGCKYPALNLGLPGFLPFGPTHVVEALAPAPEFAYLTALRVGGIVFAAVPGEPTTTLGRRTERLLEDRAGVEHAVVIGLANGYTSYLTAPEEYACQHYEGASSLYGTYAGLHMRGEVAALAEVVLQAKDRSTLPRRPVYRPGLCSSYDMDDMGCLQSVSALLRDLGLCAADDLPRHRFVDEKPAWPESGSSRVWPGVVVEHEHGGRWSELTTREGREDDTTRRIFLLAKPIEGRAGHVCWTVVWMPPPDLEAEGRYRFRVTCVRGAVHRSPEFALP